MFPESLGLSRPLVTPVTHATSSSGPVTASSPAAGQPGDWTSNELNQQAKVHGPEDPEDGADPKGQQRENKECGNTESDHARPTRVDVHDGSPRSVELDQAAGSDEHHGEAAVLEAG